MCIAIEGPEVSAVDFNKILDVHKEQNRRILLYLFVVFKLFSMTFSTEVNSWSPKN